MIQIKISVWLSRRLRVVFQFFPQPVVHVPIGSVNRDVTIAIASLFQKGAHTVSLLCCVAFFQVGKAKPSLVAWKLLEQRLGAQDVLSVFFKLDVGVIPMRIGVIAD